MAKRPDHEEDEGRKLIEPTMISWMFVLKSSGCRSQQRDMILRSTKIRVLYIQMYMLYDCNSFNTKKAHRRSSTLKFVIHFNKEQDKRKVVAFLYFGRQNIYQLADIFTKSITERALRNTTPLPWSKQMSTQRLFKELQDESVLPCPKNSGIKDLYGSEICTEMSTGGPLWQASRCQEASLPLTTVTTPPESLDSLWESENNPEGHRGNNTLTGALRLQRLIQKEPGTTVGFTSSELPVISRKFRAFVTCSLLNVIQRKLSDNVSHWCVDNFYKNKRTSTINTNSDRPLLPGTGAYAFAFPTSLVLHHVLNSETSVVRAATSGEIPGVDEFELTLATTALFRELQTLDLLSIILKQINEAPYPKNSNHITRMPRARNSMNLIILAFNAL
ncbi:hypothetical protein Tco_0277667 [Tanacetum coccineum]